MPLLNDALSQLVDDLFSCLGKGGVKHLHLLREVLLQPLVLLYHVFDELYRHFTADFYGTLTFLASVEPCLRPPDDAVLVGIDTDPTLYVETLYVDVKVGKGVDYTLT